MKKIISMVLAVIVLCGSLVSCKKEYNNDIESLPSIDSLLIGEDYKDLEADITFLTFRTDIMDKLENYASKFNKIYPGIRIRYKGISDYENSVITYLNSNTDWGDIMMIPLGIEKDAVSKYFIPLGNSSTLKDVYNFTSAWEYDGQVYGLASTGNANGILYNKKVFSDAGVSEIPKTPDEFIDSLKMIKRNTSAIPLYTNYADKWPMSSWDAYFSINATGLSTYNNQILVHAKNPFSNNNNSTGPYSVYKILYDAVANNLTEEDYTTTSEQESYKLLNEGKIGTLVFSSWAVVQAKEAGNHPNDIGFMPFPISVNGKQYVSINGDYSYGISNKTSYEKKIASMLYIKWLVEDSGYSYSEGGLSVKKDGENPDFYDNLSECVLMENDPAIEGEETLFDELNKESGLLFNANGNEKVQKIVEHAFKGDKAFDSIMNDWNAAWSDAQKKLDVEIK